MTTKFDIYQEVTDRIVNMLETSTYTKRWVDGFAGVDMPTNNTGRAYRGINILLLWAASESKGYTSGVWGTYKSWKTAGAQVRKGEKGTMVVFWKKIVDRKDEDKMFMFAKAYSVFSAEQVDGFDLAEFNARKASAMPNTAESLDEVDAALEAYRTEHKISLKFGGNRACYSPGRHAIRMPTAEQFRDTESFYGTMIHEHIHSTGHASVLGRDMTGRFGNDAYAFEELVAELGSAMACSIKGIEDDVREDHAGYVKSWLTVLKNDKRAIFTAASKAQQAVDCIFGKVEAV